MRYDDDRSTGRGAPSRAPDREHGDRRPAAPIAPVVPVSHAAPAPAARVLAAVTMAGYWAPALAGNWPPPLPWGPAPIWPALREALGVEDRTAGGEGCALTFDDGPHVQGTPAVLEILADRGVRATFFLVGEQVLRNPGLAGEIVAAGHWIGLHCHRHRNLLRLAPWQVRDDIARAGEAIEGATGVSPRLYRPPYGVLNATALRLARREERRTLLWSHWGRDWERGATAESIATRVTDGAGEGSVLLLHDADDYSASGSWRRTAQALPRVLDTLAERGLQAVEP